jgi:hypothetical protein
MLPFERVQHALLALSFMTLVWTGFALKYPDTWWARPLLIAGRNAQYRSSSGGGGFHSGVSDASGIADRQPETAQSLEGNASQAGGRARGERGFRLQYGLGSSPPERSPHSYVEKAEYWAVVWGAIVMAIHRPAALGQ